MQQQQSTGYHRSASAAASAAASASSSAAAAAVTFAAAIFLLAVTFHVSFHVQRSAFRLAVAVPVFDAAALSPSPSTSVCLNAAAK